jgi:phenylacetate-CoA ligase
MIKNVLLNSGCTLTGTYTEKEYREISNITDPDALHAFIEHKLNNLLRHAYKHTQYYHRIFDQIGIVQGEHVNLSRIHEIPLLTKEIIRKHHEELISDDFKDRGWFYNTSGGSTGEPVRLIQDRQFQRWAKATNNYYYRNILNIDEPIVKKIIVWGSERDLFTGTIGAKTKITNWLTNTIMLNSFKMTPNDIEKYISIINTYKPDLIRGYAGSLYEICRYAEINNLNIYSPKVIVSAAETLNDDMRDQIERVFGKKLYNFYGSREVSNLAGECKDGLMHSFAFWNYQELLDEHNLPVKQGEEGKVVVTNLFNYSMPLIRYEIGDMAVLGPEHCSCGKVLPTFEKITGRITDHFILKNGATVPAEFFIHLLGVVCNTGEIKQFQVVQEDYDRIRILAVIGVGLTEEYRKNVESKIKVAVGLDCEITWDFVDNIPKTPTGKYLFTKSLVRR